MKQAISLFNNKMPRGALMTPRQNMINAITGNSPDYIPVVLPYFHLYLDYISQELSDLTWAHRLHGTPEERAEFYSLARTCFGLDWLPVGGIGTSLKNIAIKLVEEDGERKLIDTVTGNETPCPERKPVETPVVKRSIETADDIGKLPPVLTTDEIIGTGVLDPVSILLEKFGDEVMLSGGVSLPVSENYFLLGVYDMFTALKLEPELVHLLIARSKAKIINLLEAQSRVGISIVWLEDCFIAGDLISREDYEMFFHEANLEIMEAARRFNLYSIYYITGDVMSRIPHILEMKPDCLAFEESRKTFIAEPVEIRKAVGDDICLFGNIDVYADIERGNTTDWEQAIGRQLKAACPDGKFILSAGSPITHDTPKEKVREFVRFAKSLVKKPQG